LKEFGRDWSKSGSLLQLVPARSRCCGVGVPIMYTSRYRLMLLPRAMEDEDGTDGLEERATDARRHVIKYLRYGDIRRLISKPCYTLAVYSFDTE